MKELKITRERVLEASERCEQAREVLEAMFPEAFEEEWVDITKEIEWKTSCAGSKLYYLQGYYEGKEALYWYASEGIKKEDALRNICCIFVTLPDTSSKKSSAVNVVIPDASLNIS